MIRASGAAKHCMYAALGKSRQLAAQEVRQIICDKAEDYWNQLIEFDHDQRALEDFKNHTLDKDQWGGEEQILMWSKICRMKIEVYSYNFGILTYDADISFRKKGMH